MLLRYAGNLLIDDLYRNPGPLQFEGPGSESKAISLTVEDQDYMGRIKKLQAYLDKVNLTTFTLSSFLLDLKMH